MPKIEYTEIVPQKPKFENPVITTEYPEGQYWLVIQKEVKAGEVVDIDTWPNADFKGHRLAVDPAIASFFKIIEIQVANCCIKLNGAEGANATLFPPIPDTLSSDERKEFQELLSMKFPRATPSNRIRVIVKNTSNSKREFNGILWGSIPEYGK